MKKSTYILIILILFVFNLNGQNHKIEIKALLLPEYDQLAIQQKITFHNQSKYKLNQLVFYNWPNSFQNKSTPLVDRLLENHKSSLYFADSLELGNTQILRVTVDSKKTHFKNYEEKLDVLTVDLQKKLLPNDSIVLTLNYSVKIPSNKFTGYGKKSNGEYNLRFWYLAPVPFENGKWIASSNLGMHHQYVNPTDYAIEMHVPIGYHINSDIKSTIQYQKNLAKFSFNGKQLNDIPLKITKGNPFKNYKTEKHTIATDIENSAIQKNSKEAVFSRGIHFIESYLGKYNQENILLDEDTYNKNKIEGINVLPEFLKSYPTIFEWDLKVFNTLCYKQLQNRFFVNKNDNYWLINGLQKFLLIEYTKKYYPEVKLFGNLSKVWGLKTFHLFQMDFNDKYPFVYQFSARKNLDQSLTTPMDSLSNFNRTIVNNYKAGLGLRYLNEYLENDVLRKSLQEFSKKFNGRNFTQGDFSDIISKNTQKDVSWFFGDYLHSKKKIDYTLKKIKKKNDSLLITIKNKRNITAPVALYGVKNKEIKWKKWISNIDSTKTIKIPQGDFDKISLNYEYLYPEFNLRNNWKNVNPKLFERPLQFKFIKDRSNPYYNQIFYKPDLDYNFYDGFIIGMGFNNKALLKRNFEYKIKPAYSTKSNSMSGEFSFVYNYLPEQTSIYKISFGASGSRYHYDQNLNYTSFSPFFTLAFKRKNLRAVGNNSLNLTYLFIDKETLPSQQISEEDQYNVFRMNYNYFRPDLLNYFQWNSSIDFANNFNKFITTVHYRKLTSKKRQFDFRWFMGVFLRNDTNPNSDYFSFGLSTAQDYLFQHKLLGRSESSGVGSQQYVYADGGFKSFFNQRHQQFANQWMSTLNTSVNIWKWVEIYGDVGLTKSSGTPLFFAHESGVRFNFIHNLLELYFPVHSNIGWEFKRPNYSERIRFVLTLDAKRIFDVARRGFL